MADAFAKRHMDVAPKTSRGPGRRPRRNDVLRKLGQRIRTIRQGLGMTQQQLANALDLSIAYVSLIERGNRNPSFTTVVALAHGLGVSLRDVCSD